MKKAVEMSLEKVVALIIVLVVLVIVVIFMTSEQGPYGWILSLINFLNSTTDTMAASN